jgi:hypothetical protein
LTPSNVPYKCREKVPSRCAEIPVASTTTKPHCVASQHSPNAADEQKRFTNSAQCAEFLPASFHPVVTPPMEPRINGHRDYRCIRARLGHSQASVWRVFPVGTGRRPRNGRVASSAIRVQLPCPPRGTRPTQL